MARNPRTIPLNPHRARIVVAVPGSTGIMLFAQGSDCSEQEDQRYDPEANAESDTFALALDGIVVNFTAHLEWIEQEGHAVLA